MVNGIKEMKDITLKDYQVKALANIQQNYDSKIKSQILIMATGTGKTVVFTRFIKDNPDKRFLILVHRDHLVSQSLEKISHQMPESVGIEKAESRAWQERIVIASVQTLKGKRLKAFQRNRFDVIIIDECHRSTADSYIEVRKHFSKAHVLGVTATPERNDERKLSKKHYKKIAFEYDFIDAIKDKNLSQIKIFRVESGKNISSIKSKKDDLDQVELSKILSKPNYIKFIYNALVEYANNKKVVIFMPSVKSSYSLSKFLNRKGIKSCSISAKTEYHERNVLLSKFKKGDIKVVCNYNIFTEGFDEPSIDCVIMARPTKSRIFYSQAIGRMMRLHESKTHGILVDVGFINKTHKLVNSLNLNSKFEVTPDIIQEADKIILNLNGKDLSEALKVYEKQLLDIIQTKKEAKKRNEIEKETRKRKQVQHDYLLEIKQVPIWKFFTLLSKAMKSKTFIKENKDFLIKEILQKMNHRNEYYKKTKMSYTRGRKPITKYYEDRKWERFKSLLKLMEKRNRYIFITYKYFKEEFGITTDAVYGEFILSRLFTKALGGVVFFRQSKKSIKKFLALNEGLYQNIYTDNWIDVIEYKIIKCNDEITEMMKIHKEQPIHPVSKTLRTMKWINFQKRELFKLTEAMKFMKKNIPNLCIIKDSQDLESCFNEYNL